MKASKCQIVSDRMRSISKGGYTPFRDKEVVAPGRNPYDSPYSNLPRYNGRIKW